MSKMKEICKKCARLDECDFRNVDEYGKCPEFEKMEE